MSHSLSPITHPSRYNSVYESDMCVHYAQSAPSMPLGACPDCRRTLYILTMTADKDDDTDDPPT